MARVFRIVAIGLLVAWLVALALLAIGTFGLFGQEREPLSAIFVLPLGLPWTFLFSSLSDAGGPWVAILSPLLKIIIFASLARMAKPRTRSK